MVKLPLKKAVANFEEAATRFAPIAVTIAFGCVFISNVAPQRVCEKSADANGFWVQH